MSYALVVATEAAIPLRVALTSISDLELNRGKSAARGQKKGFLCGAAIGFPLAYLICDGASCNISALKRFGTALEVSALYGGIGALIGRKVGSDEWVSYPLPSGAAISPAIGLSERGTQAGIRLSY